MSNKPNIAAPAKSSAPAPSTTVRFSAELQPSTFDQVANTIDVIAYAGAVVERYSYDDGPFQMVLKVDAGSIDLSRLDSGAANLIDSHEAYSIEDIYGAVVPGSCRIENGQLLCKVKLSVDPEKAGVVADVIAGIIRNISVGFNILQYEVVEATATLPRQVIVTLWQPFELSLVAVGADPGAHTFERDPRAGAKPMTLAANPVAPTATDPNASKPAENIEQLKAEAASKERNRIREIGRIGKFCKASPEQIEKWENSGASLDEVRREAFELQAQAADKVGVSSTNRIEVGATAVQKLREGVIGALLFKANPGNAKFAMSDEAKRFGARRTADIARMYLAELGHDVATMTEERLLQRAFFAHSTSDLPDLLGDAMGKRLLSGYAELPNQYAKFCAKVPLSGLYDYKAIDLAGAGDLPDVPEGSDYPEVALTESQETFAAKKGGNIIAITLEMLLKDNLDGLSRLPMAQSQAAMRREHKKIAALLTPNTNHGATMSDSVALFNSAHSNLIASGGAAPSATTLDATELLIADQLGLDGEKLGLEGRIIVVPRALRHVAQSLFSPRYVPTASTGVLDPTQETMSVAEFNYLTSTKIWYVFADPNIAPVICYGYPDNVAPLSLSRQEGFDNDTIKYKVSHWFGCGIVDYRGAAMNPGE